MTRTKVKAGEIEVFHGSGNVWEDLGFPDAEELPAKTELVVAIDRTVRSRRLTQSAAARLMGIDQPKVSKLLNGDYRGFSTHRLMELLRFSLLSSPARDALADA
ncbi:MAG: helix-turn-helix domain-containing protein [Gemmatimonadetes bacterium]|nr:helix-turn-helix domain-containing protein [Gemmatimonadota bacterium]